ncbi:hypothetical protein [Bifidobacterium biavatii]|uniref:Uncharacterized protein n=1 Tax=Bifidobacterium biavatii DSM 23969 TaxID=1437608 RepID=A0A086ZHU0_9BIFI|nr:hypothetical protein [Bifidobacterium biavatii]KFI46090.1 hypothetical protein BBIA_2052 [Bifidobacterium biavatii DSM 23969]
MTRFTRRCGKLVAAVLAGGMILATPATAIAEPAADAVAGTPAADSAVAFPTETMTGCDDVQTWAKLVECAGNTAQDTIVTVTAPIVADKDATVNVTKTIGLTTKLDGPTPVLTSADGDTTGQLFDVKSGGKLIVGADANDKFTYGGTKDKTATRRFARIEENGVMQVNGGTFRYLTVNDLPETVSKQNETAAVALNMGGTLLVSGGTFDHIDTGSAGATGVFSNNGGTVTIDDGTFKNNTGVRGSVLSDMDVTGANSSTVTINGGTFESNHTSYAGGVAYLTNTGKTDGKYEGVYKVTGGTFVGHPRWRDPFRRQFDGFRRHIHGQCCEGQWRRCPVQ